MLSIDLEKVETNAESCEHFKSKRMGQLRVVSEAVHVPDNSVVVRVVSSGS